MVRRAGLTPSNNISIISEMSAAMPSTDLLDAERLARVASALGDAGRVRLLAACLERERCVCQLVALVGLSAATVSKHLSLLRDAGLLTSRKDGRWVHYRLAEIDPGTPEGDAIAMVGRLAASGALDADRAQLETICGLEPSEVTRRLKRGEPVCPPDCC